MVGRDIEIAAELLRQGKLVGIPTETVYGLAANALNEHAVRRIFEVKRRPAINPLIIHLADSGLIDEYAFDIPECARMLVDAFCPGPLTVVLPAKNKVPQIVRANRKTVAIRIPAHPLTQELLKAVGLPLAAPSANPSGYISPTNAAHVAKYLGGKIDYILDGGDCNAGIESTIVGFENDRPVIYREGIITVKDISAVAGPVQRYSGKALLAPGMSAAHYSPNTALILTDLIDHEVQKNSHKTVGVITYNEYSNALPVRQQIVLCEENDFESAAKNLYAAMHTMDEEGYDLIIARKFPDSGIGIALNDRLKRAAAKQ